MSTLMQPRPVSAAGLHWVQGELDQSLARARQQIEQHMESPGDAMLLRQAVVELHQVRGTAAMIQCFGVATLAEEMRNTLQDLLQDRIKETEAAYSALLGATIQLADYVDALAGGMQDCVLVFQPVINELRLARGRAVLTEPELFAEHMRAVAPATLMPPSTLRAPAAAQSTARQYLPVFQHNLLHWLKSQDSGQALGRMGKVGELVGQATTSMALYQLWRIFSAAVEAVLTRGLEETLEVKRLFGRVGAQIKLLAEGGQDAAIKAIGDLPFQLLYYIGRSRASGPRVNGLREIFQLDLHLPPADTVEELRQKVRGPNTTLLTRLSEEIGNDFTEIKDSIDLVVRAGSRAPGDLSKTVDRINRMGTTLGMVGLEQLGQVLKNQALVLEDLRLKPETASDRAWLDVATALLRVEHSLEDALFRQLRQPGAPLPVSTVEEGVPHAHDLRESRFAVLRESLVNLAKLKTLVDTYIKTGDAGGIADGSQLLVEVESGLRIVAAEHAASQVSLLRQYVASASFAQMREGQGRPERFADAVACIEYYIEALQRLEPEAERILKDLDGYVTQLDLRPAPAAAPADVAADRVPAPAVEVLEPPKVAPAPAAPAAAVPSAPAPVTDVDPEIREIFIEEATDVLAQLEGTLPRWKKDPNNADALTEIRRAFHTLKGSGRMVGATQIGDFGWALESLLNGCLEGSLEVSPAVTGVVVDAVAMLPALIAGFREGRAPEEALVRLIDRAQQLREGRAEAAEPEMVAVFKEDARERVAVIEQWLGGLDRSHPEYEINADMVRAVHTLRGSAALVEAHEIAQVAAALEEYIEAVKHAGMKLSPTGVTVVGECTAEMKQWIERYGRGGVDPRAALERIETAQAALPVAAVEAAADRRLADVFATEALDLLQGIEQTANAWRQHPEAAFHARSLKSLFQTLQQAAVAARCGALGNVAAAFDSRLSEFVSSDADSTPDAAFFARLHNLVERTYQLLDAYRDGSLNHDGSQLAARVYQLQARGGGMPEPAAGAAPKAAPSAPAPAAPLFAKPPEPPVVAEPAAPPLIPEPAPRPPLQIFEEPATADHESFLLPETPAAATAPEPTDLEMPPVATPSEVIEVLGIETLETIDPELVQIFVSEGEELLGTIDRQFDVWERNPEAREPVAELARALHTLKGSARMAGLNSIGDVAQRMESLLESVVHGRVARDAALFGRMHNIVEGLYRILEDVRHGRSAPDVEHILAELEGATVPAAPRAEAAADAEMVMPPVEEVAPATEAPAPAVEAPLDFGFDELEAEVPAESPPIPTAPTPPMPTRAPEPEPWAKLGATQGVTDPWAKLGTTQGVADPWARLGATQGVSEPWARLGTTQGVATPQFDPDLAEIFTAEASELLELLDSSLRKWQVDPDDHAPLREVQRALHTLKGGARMAGLMAMGTAAHEMESRVERMALDQVSSNAPGFDRLHRELEILQRMHDRLVRGEGSSLVDEAAFTRIAEALRPQPPAAAAPQPQAPTPIPVQAPEPEPLAEIYPEPEPPPAPVEPAIPAGPWDAALFWRPEEELVGLAAQRRELARVPVETLDGMLNQAGEISIYRSRLEQHNTAINFQLKEMDQTIGRVRELLRQMDMETEAQVAARGFTKGIEADRYATDFDPLEMDRYSRMQELSRALSESINDLASLHSTMDEQVSEADTLLLQQGRINTEVQQGLMGTLMVPFSRQVQRLQRVVRQAAQETGKEAEVGFDGIEAELDRNVLERMTAPLEHLLRNAVVHGIEPPEVRAANGKPAQGRIAVRLWRDGTQLAIEVRDDGKGLDYEAIRRTAVERGLAPEGATLSEVQIAQFIFESGFSTAREVTQAAGRGVGMDVVAAEVKQLGGTLELASEAGQGARFLIRLPLTLAIAQSLLIGLAQEMYAVPLTTIEGITRLPRDQLPQDYKEGGTLYQYGGQDYRVRYLGDLLGLPAHDSDARTLPAIFVRMSEGLGGARQHRVCVVVDTLYGNREVVSKAVGPQVASVAGVTGATILADGRVVLILDIPALITELARRALVSEMAVPGQEPVLEAVAPPVAADERTTIMVVDDSITIRRVTERLLTKNGYRVVTAKDGLDAMALLQTETPATILLDIEMPRADGFEVAAFIRNNERLKRVPIIMITSRSGEKHRERAMQIGVNRYLIKPYQEEQLLSELHTVRAA